MCIVSKALIFAAEHQVNTEERSIQPKENRILRKCHKLNAKYFSITPYLSVSKPRNVPQL